MGGLYNYEHWLMEEDSNRRGRLEHQIGVEGFDIYTLSLVLAVLALLFLLFYFGIFMLQRNQSRMELQGCPSG